MDIGRSLTFATQDQDWIKKVLVGAVVGLIPILNIALLGYQLEIARRVYQGAELPLPDWDDMGGYWVRGLLAALGALLWMLPLLAIVLCLLLVGFAADSSGSLAALLSFCVGAPLLVVFGVFIYPVVLGRYAVEGTFGAMFEFGEIAAEVRRAPAALLMYLLVFIIAAFIAWVGVIACFIGVFVTSAYAYIVLGHALGQTYRKARPLGPARPVTAF